MLGKINILVRGSIEEDADDYMGAIIEDYNEAEGILHLFVDADEIEASFLAESEIEHSEAWGQMASREIVDLHIFLCDWKGHSIINEEDVVWDIIKTDGGQRTWH
jgi:hypothetical protein